MNASEKAKLRTSILAAMKKAPRGVRGTRGKLVHLQDPAFITTDAELLMTRPTMKLTPLVKAIADRIGVNRPLVQKVIAELESKNTLAITSERNSQGIPKLIPITRNKGYHTDKIGSFAHGQFAGFVFFLEPEQQRLVSVLHVFDKFGFHQQSSAWDCLAGCDPKKELDNAIDKLIQAHPADIQVQLFTVDFFETTFGLIASDDDHVEYVPYGLGFNPPWSGLYDT